MSDSNTILVGEFDEFIWVRCEGKGSFLTSGAMKAWVDERLDGGVKQVVIDLEDCKGMDSTFMGTLAGISMRLAKVPGGQVDVISAGDKNSRSLKDLGLSSLMAISRDEGGYDEQAEEVRGRLVSCKAGGKADRAQHVFDAHKTLCEADEDNNDKFATVLDCLEAELAERKRD